MRRAAPLCLIALLSSACVTGRGRTDGPGDGDDLLAVAEAYDAQVEASPHDPELRAHRARARAAAVADLLLRLHRARQAERTDEAIDLLSTLLDARDRWSDDLAPELTATIARDVRWVSAHITTLVGRFLDTDRPAAAAAVLASRRARLNFDDFAPLWPQLAGQIRVAGELRCDELAATTTAETPYLGNLIAAYCRRLGVDQPGPAHLPHAVAGLTLDDEIDGVTDAQRAALATALDGWLRDSRWYGADGERADGSLAGSHQVAFDGRLTHFDVPWTEQVPYLASESYEEPYQESYTDTESYLDSEPYTDYSTETYSCGYGSSYQTCTRSVSSTKYRSVYKTRTVTKHRTAYRTQWRTVTRYRAEPRELSFDAIERHGSYASAWTLTVDLGPAAARLALKVVDHQDVTGYDHDISHAGAGVTPSRANLPAADAWFDHMVGQLGPVVRAELLRAWDASFCAEATYTTETAARCAYGGGSPPHAARVALAAVFGDEIDQAIAP